MAVRAEDIVRNSEVSARVRAGPPERAVPRVTDALKSATFEPQCHDRPLGGSRAADRSRAGLKQVCQSHEAVPGQERTSPR
jgi:hypothetical protein